VTQIIFSDISGRMWWGNEPWFEASFILPRTTLPPLELVGDTSSYVAALGNSVGHATAAAVQMLRNLETVRVSKPKKIAKVLSTKQHFSRMRRK